MLPLDIPIDIGRDEAQRRAAEELAKSKYGRLPPWMQDFVDWLQKRLADFLSWLLNRPTDGGGRGGTNWVVIVVIVVVVAAVALVIWKVGLPRLPSRRKGETFTVSADTSPAHYRGLAEHAAATGNHREACLEVFRGLVRDLEDHGVIAPRPARTAAELAHIAGTELPAAAEALDRAAWVFSAAVYADQPATRAQYDDLCELDRRIMAVATGIGAAA